MKKRATTEAEKAEKANRILEKAAERFLECDYEKIKMSELAKELNLSNGILFVYFRTKETLFMSLLRREYEKRIRVMLDSVESHPVTCFSDVKKLLLMELTELVEHNPLYVRLEAMRSAVFERNTDLDTLYQMKKSLYEQLSQVSERICKEGVLTFEQLSTILNTESAILTGAMLNASLSQEVLNIMDSVGMSAFKPDFKKDALNAFRYFLDGYERSL